MGLSAMLGLLINPSQVALAQSVNRLSGASAVQATPSFVPAASVAAAPAESAPTRLPLHVCSIADECYTLIQAAVDAASDDDVILVAAGVYTGVEGRIEPNLGSRVTQTVMITKSITLRGGYTTTNWIVSYPLTQPTIIDPQGQGRVIYISRDAGVTVTIEGFSITNGVAAEPFSDDERDFGGGLYIYGGNHLIQNNWIYSNTADRRGGGVYLNEGNTVVQGNWIYSNTALASTGAHGGGGIYIRNTAPIIRGNWIYSNTAEYRGGGIYVLGYDDAFGRPNIERNQIHHNATNNGGGSDGGGGIYVGGSGGKAETIIRDNAIYSNTVGGTNDSGAGVAIFLSWYANMVTVERNDIHHNNGAQYGGGVYADNKAHVVRNNIVYHNAASLSGAGIYYRSEGGLIENNTTYSNTYDGIYSDAAGAIIRNNIAISNYGAGIGGPASLAPAVNYNDAYSNTTDYSFGAGVVSTTNISQDPLFIDPGVDFRPQSGSPVIDAADPDGYPDTDYTGFGRPFNARADMGAYEDYSGTCFARIGAGRVYTNAQALIDSTTSPTDVIKVAGVCTDVFARNVGGSTFTQTIYVSAGLTLRGGYAPTYWDNPITRTVIDGGGIGRGLYLTGSAAITVDGFVIRNGRAVTNSGDYGGGIYVGSALDPLIQNVILYSNTANYGAGLAAVAGSARLYNNTIVSNAAIITGGGVYLTGGGSPVVSNTIVVSNVRAGIAASGATPSLAYNDVWQNTILNYAGISAGATDLSVNPLFVNPMAGDFHLSASSPAVQSGDPNTTVLTDLEGDARPLPSNRTWYDIGADESAEYPDVTFNPKSQAATGLVGEQIVYSYTLVNAGSLIDAFNLTHASVLTQWVVSYVSPQTLQPGEARQVLVTVTVGAPLSLTQNFVYITATSTVNPQRVFDVVSATTVINAGYGVTITPQYVEGLNPSTVVTYFNSLKNSGGSFDTYTVTWGHTPAYPASMGIDVGNAMSGTFNVSLEPGATMPLTIPLTVYGRAPGGLVKTIILTATSTFSPSLQVVMSDTFTVNYFAGTRYVREGGGSTDDYNNCLRLDGAPPCAGIAHGVEQAVNGDEIHIADGTYYEHDLLLNKNVTLRGGYFPNFIWSPQNTVSAIDAQGLGRVLYILGNPTVEYLTVRNGNVGGPGGGVYVFGSPRLQHNIIVNNTATNGGGVYVGSGSPIVAQNIITHNVATGAGGGLYNAASQSPNLEQNTLAFNSAGQGGGFANNAGTPSFWNNMVYRNTATDGGGVYVGSGSPRVWHNTIYTNTASGTGGGVYLGSGSPVVSNTIVASNSAPTASGVYSATSGAQLGYNDVFGNNLVGLSLGATDKSLDPQFRSAETFDLRLQSTSGLVDVGQPSSVVNDNAGQPRPVGGGPDIGADEFLLAALVIQPNNSATGLPGETKIYTHAVTNNGNYTDTVAFTILSSQDWRPYSVSPPTMTLGISQTDTIWVSLKVPIDVISSTVDSTVVTATSGNDELAWSASDTTIVQRSITVTLEPHLEGLGRSGQTTIYTHTLLNRGNYTDTFDLAAGSAKGYTVTIAPVSATLAGSASRWVTLTIQVPTSVPTTTPAVVDTSIITAVSRADTNVYYFITDTTYVNRYFGVTLTPNRSSGSAPGASVIYTHTLSNTGNYTDTFTFPASITYTPSLQPQNWGVTLNPAAVQVGGQQSRTVTVTIDIPSRTVSQTAMLSGTLAAASITATSQFTPLITYRLVDTTTVTHAPNIDVTPLTAQACLASAQPTTVTQRFDHQVVNTGNFTNTFTVTAASLRSWIVTVNPTTLSNVGPDQSTSVAVTLSVPPGQSVPNDTVLVTVTSQLSPTVRKVATDTTSFSGLATLTWSPTYSQSTVSDFGSVSVYYTHTLAYSSTLIPTTNTVSFGYRRNDQTPAWGAVVQPSSVAMTNEQVTTVTARVDVPYATVNSTNPGHPFFTVDNLVVTATTQLGCEVQLLPLDTHLRRPRVDLTKEYDGIQAPGQSIEYLHYVRNTGGMTDTYTLTYTGDLPWSASVTPMTVTSLAPNAEQLVTVRVDVPDGVLSDTLHTLILTATSTFNGAVYEGATDLTRAAYVPNAALSTHSAGAADPGTSITYTHVLTNLGNYSDTFFLTVLPGFGSADLSPLQTPLLGPDQSYPITVVVTLPPQAAGGETESTRLIATYADNQRKEAIDLTLVNYLPGTRFVATSGTDLHNNCLMLEGSRACVSLQQAVNQAAPGDEIHVAQGTYAGTTTIDESVIVKGGYTSANWSAAPNPIAQPTLLDAQGAGRTLTIVGSVTVTIDGFRITGGSTAGAGGAIAITTTRPVTLSANLIYNNAALDGGAIYANSGSVTTTLVNNLIYRNAATGSGGAVYIAGNTLLLNNTLAANTASDSGGAVCLLSGTLSVANTILFSNTALIAGGGVYSASVTAVYQADYNDLWNNAPDNGNVPIGSHSLTADPLFRDATVDDYHLTGFSPGVNRGYGLGGLFTTDFEGDSRPQLGAWDIGADELYQMQGWQFNPVIGDLKKSTDPQVVYTHVLTNTGNYTDAAALTATINRAGWSVNIYPSVTPQVGSGMTTTAWITVNTSFAPIQTLVTTTITATSQTSATMQATALDVTMYQSQADLDISKSVSPSDWIGNGDPFTYTATYINNGPSVAYDVIITDGLTPLAMTRDLTFTYSGLTVTQRSGGSPYAWDVVQPPTQFTSGTVGLITLTGSISASTGLVAPLTNTVEIATSQEDVNSNNNTDTAIVWIDTEKPIVTSIPQIAPANTHVTYTRDITFSWDAAAFSDQTGSGGAGYVLAINGATYSTSVTVTVPTSATPLIGLPYDDYAWTVRAFDHVGNVGDPSAPFTLTVALPSLSVSKIATPTVPVAGKPFTYVLTVSNIGKIMATNMVLTDALPGNSRFISASPNGVQVGSVISWTGLSAGPLSGTAQATLVVSACQTITNTAYRVVTSTEGVSSTFGAAVATTFASPYITPTFARSASPFTGVPVAFTDTTSTNGVLAGWAWAFGDSSPNAAGSVMSHTYSYSGTYLVTLTITNTCGLTRTTSSSINVAGAPTINVSPASLTATLNNSSTATATLAITNTGTASLNWTLAENPSMQWLSESSAGGTLSPGTNTRMNVTFTVPATYTAGVRTTTLQINSNDPGPGKNPINVPVTLTVRAPDIDVTPLLFEVGLDAGQITTRSLTIANLGDATLHYTPTETASWLTVSAGGTIGAGGPASPLTLSFDSSGLTPGVYPTTLAVDTNDPDEDPVNVPVTLTVNARLTVNVVGSGSVTRLPNQTTYAPGSVVTLTATPISGWLFSGWGGALTGVTNPVAITMNGNKTVTATFSLGCVSVSGLDFVYTPSSPIVGRTVAFTASATGGTQPVAYAWDFGDTGTASGATASHAFSLDADLKSKQFTVKVTATNACTSPGAQQSKTITVAPYGIYLPAVLKNR